MLFFSQNMIKVILASGIIGSHLPRCQKRRWKRRRYQLIIQYNQIILNNDYFQSQN